MSIQSLSPQFSASAALPVRFSGHYAPVRFGEETELDRFTKRVQESASPLDVAKLDDAQFTRLLGDVYAESSSRFMKSETYSEHSAGALRRLLVTQLTEGLKTSEAKKNFIETYRKIISGSVIDQFMLAGMPDNQEATALIGLAADFVELYNSDPKTREALSDLIVAAAEMTNPEKAQSRVQQFTRDLGFRTMSLLTHSPAVKEYARLLDAVEQLDATELQQTFEKTFLDVESSN